MTSDAIFWIASESKPITATALMMLVDEGKVNVEDPVERYLPEFKGQMVAAERTAEHVFLKRAEHPIKVREILSHTSGLPFRSPLEEPTLDVLPLRDRVRSYAMLPLQFEPGTRYEYSNAGINTAGRIIEVVSGMSYEAFLEERLFQPLGMKDTTFWPNERQLRRLAKSYRPATDGKALEETPITQLRYPLNDRSRQPMPAGGLFSTAQDLTRFCQMILNSGVSQGRRYLSSGAIVQMTRKQTGDMVKEGYGFGWSMRGSTFGHGGAYGTALNINPDTGLITVLMIQQASFAGQEGTALDQAIRQAAAQFSSR
jgi:CubicO group peptidase (beta-lactamase class C family)